MKSSVEIVDGKLTLEEFEHLPEEGPYRLELSRGRLVREPRPGARHGWLVGRLYGLLEVHAREQKLGMAAVETGFVLSVEPPTVRGPDVAFIAASKIPPGELPLGFWPMAPDLAVEVLSPSNRPAEIHEKVLEYLAAGTRLVWVVDPVARSVTLHRAGGEIQLLEEGDVLDGEDVLPGLLLPLTDLFEPYRPE